MYAKPEPQQEIDRRAAVVFFPGVQPLPSRKTYIYVRIATLA